MEKLYPLRLTAVSKSPIWSGERLTREWGRIPPAGETRVGESWVLTVREKENSAVIGGAFDGELLASLIRRYGTAITGSAAFARKFPLLIKLIDAGDDLSVQVHPDDAYAGANEGCPGKTEMWYIADADPGAELILGLADGVDRDGFAEAVRDGKTERALRHLPVRPGEVYFIPAGLVHAIGGGILIAEIQQNCDVTYRVWDYGRLQADGKPRQLHVRQALDVVRPIPEEEIDRLRFRRGKEEVPGGELLADSAYFRVESFATDGELCFPDDGRMRHLLCLAGEGEVICGNDRQTIGKGDSYLIPASLRGVRVTGSLRLLVSMANGGEI